MTNAQNAEVGLGTAGENPLPPGAAQDALLRRVAGEMQEKGFVEREQVDALMEE